MRIVYILMIVLLTAWRSMAQTSGNIHRPAATSQDVSYTPVAIYNNNAPNGFVFTSGPNGPIQINGGELFPAGYRLPIAAIPARGYKFENWQRVNVFFFTEYTVNASGQLNPPIMTSEISPVPTFRKNPLLVYQVQPEEVLYFVPNVITIVQINGWMANFVPIQHSPR